jgi:hypothetical protein
MWEPHESVCILKPYGVHTLSSNLHSGTTPSTKRHLPMDTRQKPFLNSQHSCRQPRTSPMLIRIRPLHSRRPSRRSHVHIHRRPNSTWHTRISCMNRIPLSRAMFIPVGTHRLRHHVLSNRIHCCTMTCCWPSMRRHWKKSIVCGVFLQLLQGHLQPNSEEETDRYRTTGVRWEKLTSERAP